LLIDAYEKRQAAQQVLKMCRFLPDQARVAFQARAVELEQEADDLERQAGDAGRSTASTPLTGRDGNGS
jgi:hypothetical protein